MNTTNSVQMISPISIGFGLLAALLVFAVLTDRKVPLIANDRVALLVLLILGMAMCANGIGRVAQANAWLHPISILGYLLGAVILLIGAAALLGFSLPLVSSLRHAIILISLFAGAKLVLSLLHHMIWM